MRKWLAAALLVLAGCTDATIPQVDTSVIGAGDDWDNPGGDWAGSHFSRLTDIAKENVDQLGLAWEYDLGTARVQEATPVVIDGVMYTSGNLGRVYALNAATGEELWTFTPEVDMQANRAACCDQANRGVAVRTHESVGVSWKCHFISPLSRSSATREFRERLSPPSGERVCSG